jgi:hypothetical protein
MKNVTYTEFDDNNEELDDFDDSEDFPLVEDEEISEE